MKTKIKICGITNINDALFAQECGADFLGFIFYKKSPRYILPLKAKEIIDKLDKKIKKVGVFVNESYEEILRIKKECGLDFVQLHGDEDLEFCEKFDLSIIIKAIRVKDEINLDKYIKLKYILLDKFSASEYGGAGKTFDWQKAVDFCKKYKGNLFVSGGLNSSNVLDAIETLHPYAVDVSSGVEKEPGKKDCDKVREFVELVNIKK